MQLVDDDALGPVDDEGSLFGHQWQGAEIDVLFLDIADSTRLGLVVDIIDDKADLDAYRGFVGKTLGDAFRLIVLGLADFVADEFEAGGTVEVFDWEDRTEDPFQTFIRRRSVRPSCMNSVGVTCRLSSGESPPQP